MPTPTPPVVTFAAALCVAMIRKVAPCAQQVALPHGVGSLHPDPAWTVIASDAFAPVERATAPPAGPARASLLAVPGELQHR